jgi:hypothetical protein
MCKWMHVQHMDKWAKREIQCCREHGRRRESLSEPAARPAQDREEVEGI